MIKKLLKFKRKSSFLAAKAAKEVGVNKKAFIKFIKKVEVYSGGAYNLKELICIAEEFKKNYA